MAEIPKNRSYSRIATLSAPADRDQSAIYTYTAQQWSVDQAEDYLEFLHAVMQQLADNPSSAPFVSERAKTRVYIARWSNARQGHRIFFQETYDGILVLRILHTAMNWSDHLSEK